jgi:excisionase family DNA binding protein
MSESFVPIEDVAKHFSVSISTVRAWVRQKHIPEDTYIKIGSTYRFRVSDVESALTLSRYKEVTASLDTKSFIETAQEVAEEEEEEEEEAMNNIQSLESGYEYDLDEDQ